MKYLLALALTLLVAPAAIAAPVSYTFGTGNRSYFTIDTSSLTGGIWAYHSDFGADCDDTYSNCRLTSKDPTVDGRGFPGNIKVKLFTNEVESFSFNNYFISRDKVRAMNDPKLFWIGGTNATKLSYAIVPGQSTVSHPVPEPLWGYALTGVPVLGMLWFKKRRKLQ